jgi:putative heme-binding domain-containing protein
MPGTLMTDAEIWRVVAFVKRLGEERMPGDAPRGDRGAGQIVYQTKGCTACHAVNGQGGDFGPDLSAIGARRSLRYLRESVVDPSADVPLAYRAVTVTTTAGTKIRGIHLNEDDYSIQLRDGNGDPRSFLKGDLQGINYEAESLMPSYRSLSAADLDNLVAYLNSLRGKAE